MATVRLVIAVVAAKHWNIQQMDVYNAFLQGDLYEEVYMTIPEGFYKIVIVFSYVDDLLIAGNDDHLIHETKGALQATFRIKDLGKLRYFLAIEFARSKDGILMHQRKYALELISDMGLVGSKPASTPMEVNQKLTTAEFDHHIPSENSDPLLSNPTAYQRIVGRLLYLTTTRPDIAFVVQCLSEFMHSPKESHMEAAIRLVKYIKQAPGLGILMNSHSLNHLSVHCDADWGSCVNSRRSTTGYLVKYGLSPICWRSKKQATIFKSSAEAEYRAMASSVAEVVIQSGLVSPHFLPSAQQPTNLFTKALGRGPHNHLMSKLGIKNIFIAPSLRGGVKELSKCVDVP
ncbi:uncharacterized mitochondrial protein AtMg00810-like [Lycium ferocissimum]|uniref:uncharacterized mitochondrial protein AtMg00810-like n=1 Tax=Lycium ferocissimum TaxID=112874 RepID=UPI0028166DCD|nr:uncharacterized mitochondrial protein AtMg00810-like [Lycium ferocissimum]